MGTKKREILIVEDSRTQATMLESTLNSEGYGTKTAYSGEEALEMLDDFDPTIIISDVVMPGMDGYELCRQIKGCPDRAQIPIILLTSLSDPYDVIKGLQCGADNFITKPYTNEFLLSRINFIISNIELRLAHGGESGIQIYFAGEKVSINSSRFQIVDLLFSSFETAVEKNNELKEVNRELEIAHTRLEDAVNEAKDANRAKGEFLAAMSHDIRTPMNGIIGMCELLKESRLDPTQVEYLNVVEQSSESLLVLINDILDLSKIEAGKMNLDVESCRLWEFLLNSVKSLSMGASNADVEILLDLDPGLPEVVEFDPNRVSQVLTNLIGNALKFTEKGEVVLAVKMLSKKGGRGEFLFSVSDTGCGIPHDRIENMFDAFTQIQDETKKSRKGTGLGLAICSKLVKLMGGRIYAESSVGYGSTFHFTISVNFKESPDSTSSLMRGVKVLLQDSNKVALDIVCRSLQSIGAYVSRVSDGRRLLNVMEDLKKDSGIPDYMFVDMETVRAHAKELMERYPETVIVPLLMNNNISEAKQVCDSLGIHKQLIKPVHALGIAHWIEQHKSGEVKDPDSDSGKVQSDSKRRLLVAEDNEVNQLVVKRLLGNLGHTVTVVSNGQEAVRILEQNEYDLVLMDIQMPVMNGFEATQEIRQSKKVKNPDIPIIALTAKAMKGDEAMCLEKGMTGYLSKPIRKSEIESMFEKVFGDV